MIWLFRLCHAGSEKSSRDCCGAFSCERKRQEGWLRKMRGILWLIGISSWSWRGDISLLRLARQQFLWALFGH